MSLKKSLQLLIVLLLPAFAMAQVTTSVGGKVTDAKTGIAIQGASVMLKGAGTGTTTDVDGNFMLSSKTAKGEIRVSYIGYVSQNVRFNLDTGEHNVDISLFAEENQLESVVVIGSGITDIAKDRKTPIAVSNIREAQIEQRLGNQEFPEILNTTPSVYATKAGGGFGDSKINIRGFDQINIAVMINGVPVNDMESGAVYWSNWAGLSDVTSAIQVQRGLGSSKLAIASVGGTINVITRSADKKQGGRVSVGIGNDGYLKTLASYNTGKSASGWSSSLLFSRTAGNTYADGTKFEGYNYYFALGYQPNKKHDFQFTFTGAPQWHDQRYYDITISDLLKYGKDGKPDRRYNSDWGNYQGEEFSMRRNYYHKPVMSLNWDWTITDASKLSTVVYASFGRGGGTGDFGSVNGRSLSSFRDPNSGLYMFDSIAYYNNAATPQDGVLIRRSSINSHNWYGIVSSFNHSINEHLNYSLGLDGRYYYGYHYQVVSDLLGASGYSDATNKNLSGPNIVSATSPAMPSWNPFGGGIDPMRDRIGYSNDGEVKWLGLFGQMEYSNDIISAFIQASVSNQGFQRIDHFIEDGTTVAGGEMHTKTGFKNLLGYDVKGGANYNIDEHNNLFANTGYYSKQPFLNAVYPNNQNLVNPYLTNEKIFGMELGYGYRSSFLNVSLNLYRTSWKDRNQRASQKITNDDNSITNAYADIRGITEIHQGVELEATSKITDYLSLNGMLSVGDYYYKGNASGNLYDESNNPLSGDVTLYLDKIKVGNAAQTTTALGFTLTPVKPLQIFGTWRYNANIYSNLNVLTFSDKEAAAEGALKLPGYGLTDAGVSYKFDLGKKQSLTLTGNVYNLFDRYYLMESYTSIHANDKPKGSSQTYRELGQIYDGIATANQVFFGFGRTWNISLSYNF